VKNVSRGFLNSKEVNTVVYDPELIQPEEMVTALKRARTYIGTADSP
jgi:hypothetical protein